MASSTFWAISLSISSIRRSRCRRSTSRRRRPMRVLSSITACLSSKRKSRLAGMYSHRKAGSLFEVTANTTSLLMRGFMESTASKLVFTLRSRASASVSSSALMGRTGAGRTDASRKLPSVSSSVRLARNLPSTRMRTRSSETRMTCLISATTPYWYISSALGSSAFISFCAMRNTSDLFRTAHSTAAMLLSRPTSKCSRLLGNTTSPRRAMAGRWRILRSTLTVTFSDINSYLPAAPRQSALSRGQFFCWVKNQI